MMPDLVRLADLDLPDPYCEPVAAGVVEPVSHREDVDGLHQDWVDPSGLHWTRRVHGDDSFGRWREAVV